MPAGPNARKGIIGDFNVHQSYTPEMLESMGYRLVGDVPLSKISKMMDKADKGIRYDKGTNIVTLFREQEGHLKLIRLVNLFGDTQYGM